MMRGRLIVLEGGEGAGKSTCARVIRDWLENHGREVVMTREPGGTKLAEAIRTLLLETRDAMPAISELLLMFAARASHVTELIAPALTEGKDVVCDRFVDSSYAYQGGGRGLKTRTIAALEKITLGKLKADLVIVLDVPANVGLSRALGRGGMPDRFERESAAFLGRVRRTFLARARANPKRYAVVNASQSADTVRRKLLKILEQRL